MNSVDKQVEKLDIKASERVNTCENDSGKYNKDKALKPLFYIVMVASLLLLVISVITFFYRFAPNKGFEFFTTGMVSIFLVCGFLLYIYSSNKKLAFIVLFLSLVDIALSVWLLPDLSILKDHIFVAIFCAVAFAVSLILLFRLIIYKMHKER